MKLLVVSQHFWPESFRINDVVRDLRAAGAEVTVLTGKPNYPDGDIFPGYRAFGVAEESFDGIPVYRVPLVPRGAGSSVRLGLNYVSFIVAAALLGPWLLRGRQFDAILVYGTSPIFQAWAAIVLGWVKRAPVVTWVQDLWPESLAVTGHVTNPRVLRVVAAAVGFTYRRHALLLGQSRAFVGAIKPMAGDVPVRYHPNPGDPPAVVEHSAPANTFDIVFAGNLGTVQALDTILEAADALRDTPRLRFLIYGSGSRAAWMAEKVVARGLANVLMMGRRDPREMPVVFAAAGALLVTLSRADILAQTIPSKVQSYLAAGRPIIGVLDGEGARVIEEAGAGVTVPAEDAGGLVAAARALYAMPRAEREAMGASGLRYFDQCFHPDTLARRLIEELWSVARRPSQH